MSLEVALKPQDIYEIISIFRTEAIQKNKQSEVLGSATECLLKF